jgi:hypothetical protein
MLHEVCVVESSGMVPQLSMARLLTEEMGFHCNLSNWSSFSIERLRASDSQLILAVAAPEPIEALDFFRSLRAGQRRVPTVAVMPHDATEELMNAMLAATDDLVLCPVRVQELRQRLVPSVGMACTGAGPNRRDVAGVLARFGIHFAGRSQRSTGLKLFAYPNGRPAMSGLQVHGLRLLFAIRE